MKSDYASRKFVIALFALILSATLCYHGRIDSATFGFIVAAVITAYITGNVAEKRVEKMPG